MHLTLEFGGGLELLCDSVKIHKVDVPLENEVEKLNMKDLLVWVRTNLIKERPEMFLKGETVTRGTSPCKRLRLGAQWAARNNTGSEGCGGVYFNLAWGIDDCILLI